MKTMCPPGYHHNEHSVCRGSRGCIYMYVYLRVI